MSNTLDLTNIQTTRTDTMNDIAELQNLERTYFNNLQTSVATKTLSDSEKDDLIDKINEISQIRVNLYKSLGQAYNFYQNNISSTHDTMREQAIAIDIVEQELNDAKYRVKNMEDEKYNKLRLIEINNYYSDSYNSHSSIMKTIIYTFVCILIITILRNRGFLTVNIFNILFVVVVIIAVIYLFTQLLYIYNKDNMVYDEYDWYFNKNNAPDINTNVIAKDPWESRLGSMCIGQACCDAGYVYDSTPSVNKCVPVPSQ